MDLSTPARRVGDAVAAVASLARAGLLAPQRPDKAVRAAGALRRFGPTPAAALESWAIRDPNRIAVIDEAGVHTYGELNQRASGLASALFERGARPGSGVGVLVRDQADFVVSIAAIARIGADSILLNTSFAAPQLSGVIEREGVRVLIHDGEFTPIVVEADLSCACVVAWPEGADPTAETIDDVIAASAGTEPPAPGAPGRTVILTSGTTGMPKGANRGAPPGPADVAAFLEAIPLKAGEVTVIAAPLFHSWGFANLGLATALGSTVVVRRRFNPARVIEDVNRCDATALVVVPVMLRRILDLPESERAVAPGNLRIIALSGSAVSAELATRGLEQFGPVLYNLYGSTEVAWATIAGPADLTAAPGCAGRPPRGTAVKLFDEDGNEVAAGGKGRIFVGNDLAFDGYTGGGTKEQIGGLMSTGDVGRFDEGGRLFVEGRDDDMIVSGGENVFPEEVEDCLNSHPGVLEAAVVGVPDEEFGQRLRAAVVLEQGAKVSELELMDFVKGQLARYKVPREIVFLDALPRTATGKILRRVIAE